MDLRVTVMCAVCAGAVGVVSAGAAAEGIKSVPAIPGEGAPAVEAAVKGEAKAPGVSAPAFEGAVKGGAKFHGMGAPAGGPGEFESADTNNDGALSLEEFKAMREKRQALMKEKMGDRYKAGGANKPSIEERFTKLDKDGNGSVSKEEMTEGRKSLMPRNIPMKDAAAAPEALPEKK